MGRWFNTAGPCLPTYHYMIPPLRRLPEAPGLVAQLGYFVVHAPRQTGKTTALSALANELTASGVYAALHFSWELARAAGDNYGRLDFELLLREFAAFWREHADVLTSGIVYHEVAPQLVIMGFLQRIVNGGGFVDREYGVGRGRMDLLIRWPYRTAAGDRVLQREALELKVWRERESDPLREGLAQLDGYLDRLGLGTGVLVVFDRRPQAAPIAERTRFEEATSPSGRPVTVLRA